MSIPTDAEPGEEEAALMNPDTWGKPAAEPERKRKSERRQRSAMVSVRFLPDELAAVQECAAEAGMTVSGYLRNLALTVASDGAARKGRDAHVSDREALGRLVREVWVECASELPDPKPSHLLGWDDLDEWNREVDRRIGERVAAAVREQIATDLERRANEMAAGGDDGHGVPPFVATMAVAYLDAANVIREGP